MKYVQSLEKFCLLTMTLLIIGCGGGGGTTSSGGGTTSVPLSDVSVSIVSAAANKCTTAYSSDSITVPAGTKVIWTNNDSVTHTVTSTSDSFSGACPPAGVANTSGELNSGNISSSGTYEHTFNTAGTYNYVCNINGHSMRGTVIVQ